MPTHTEDGQMVFTRTLFQNENSKSVCQTRAVRHAVIAINFHPQANVCYLFHVLLRLRV